LQWNNKDGLKGTKAFASSVYTSVPANKLIMGVLASTSAGGAAYYPTPAMLTSAISTLSSQYATQVGGVMMWDSHWDTLNNRVISNAAVSALGL
jgi:chitinase